MRTLENYEHDANIASTTLNHSHGVKFSSPLNQLQHFHVCNPGLPPCLAHDFFEDDIKLCINRLVQIKYITYEEINKNLKLE